MSAAKKSAPAAQHTPGPWRAEIHRDGACIKGDEGFGATIANVGPDYINLNDEEELSAEGMANACLITAAPELLAACEGVLDRLTDGRREIDASTMAEWADELAAAIAKVRGGR